MSEEDFWFRIWVIVGAVVVAIAVIVGYCDFYLPMTRGYCEQAVPGRSQTVWVKCEMLAR